MAECDHQELVEIARRELLAGRKPGVMVSFRLNSAGQVGLEVHAGGGISSAALVAAALELALAGTPGAIIGPESERGLAPGVLA
jgi:hypothetical protein